MSCKLVRFLVSVVARGVLAGMVPILPWTVPILPYGPTGHMVGTPQLISGMGPQTVAGS